jgi:adenylate kinase family enzyme
MKDAGFNFFSKKKKEAVEKNDWLNDEIMDSLTKKTAAQKSNQPKFVYTHFTRPHHPFCGSQRAAPGSC